MVPKVPVWVHVPEGSGSAGDDGRVGEVDDDGASVSAVVDPLGVWSCSGVG
jgi:hypothetical protein